MYKIMKGINWCKENIIVSKKKIIVNALGLKLLNFYVWNRWKIIAYLSIISVEILY